MIEKIITTELEKENQAEIIENSVINNDLFRFLETPESFYYKTGIELFDEVFCYKKNEFYLMTGKKGAGKTTINQIIQLIGSFYCGLKWIVCYKENTEWASKFNLLSLILKNNVWKIYKNERTKLAEALSFIDKHFFFIEAENVKDILEKTKSLIEKKQNIYGVVIDPINSLSSGYESKGNGYQDGVELASKILNFSKKYCSVYLSQHPTMTGQRSQEKITSFDGEGGWFLNKASFIYSNNREANSNLNHLTIESVRNKLTGGNTTNGDDIIINWSPTIITVKRDSDVVPIELF